MSALGDGSDGESHGGEEFALVLDGQVRFHCEGYEPVVWEVGDSVYFDAGMAHRYLQAGASPARLLCVYSHPEHARSVETDALPHSLAMRTLSDHRPPASPSPSKAPSRTATKRRSVRT